jgi:hypothetical protein
MDDIAEELAETRKDQQTMRERRERKDDDRDIDRSRGSKVSAIVSLVTIDEIRRDKQVREWIKDARTLMAFPEQAEKYRHKYYKN